MRDILQTKKADWYHFILPATVIWFVALGVTVWDFIQLQQAHFSLEVVKVVGLSMMVVGVAVRRLARWALGKQFSYALRVTDNHRLVTHGIYKRVRHPAYSGDLLFQLGVPLLFSSGYGFLVMLLLFPCILCRIRVEEEMLVEQFGDKYLEYMKRSQKLVPFVF